VTEKNDDSPQDSASPAYDCNAEPPEEEEEFLPTGHKAQSNLR
jgi:hypothetical protein